MDWTWKNDFRYAAQIKDLLARMEKASAMQLGLLRPLPQKQALRAWLMAEKDMRLPLVVVVFSISSISGKLCAFCAENADNSRISGSSCTKTNQKV